MSKLFSSLHNLQIQNTISLGDIGTLVILLLTLITAIIYAYYTKRLWKEANFQSILSISPYTIFDISRDDEVYVKNIGNGAALNVTIDPLTITDTDFATQQEVQYTLSFEPINILLKGESKQIQHKSTLPDGSPSSLSFVPVHAAKGMPTKNQIAIDSLYLLRTVMIHISSRSGECCLIGFYYLSLECPHCGEPFWYKWYFHWIPKNWSPLF
jgi:hypothetical protein